MVRAVGTADVRPQVRIEILSPPGLKPRPVALLRAVMHGAERAKLPVTWIQRPTHRHDAVLVLYGIGGKDRLPAALAHMQAGGRLISWDAGYWSRGIDTRHRMYRVSLDGFHPQRWVMQGDDPGPDRRVRSGPAIRQRGNPAGPVVLVGNGPKSNAVGAEGWTEAKCAEIRKVMPGRRLVYRPKPRHTEAGIHCDGVANGDIDDVLATASLVVCRHSNVAVDACRLGVPVVCDDGAAAAIYPSRLEDADRQPSAELRAEFLRRLAWWQWSQTEIESGAFWPWMLRQLT